MSNYSEEQVAIVVDGIEKGMKDDDILMELFQTGVAFSSLRSMFNGILADKQLRLSAKDRKSKANEILDELQPNAETESDVMLAIVAKLQTKLACSTSQAMSALRAWAKDNEVTLPKKPKKAAERQPGFTGHIKTLLDYVMGHKDVTRKQLEDFADKNEIRKTYVTTVINILEFAKSYAAEEVVEESASEEAA